jgi:hypothetical protein
MKKKLISFISYASLGSLFAKAKAGKAFNQMS